MKFDRKIAATLGFACTLGLAAGPALAARPVLHVEESVQLPVSADEAWQLVGRFGDLGWHPAIASTEITAGQDGRKGAVRRLTTKDGAVLVERLLARSDRERSLTYGIVESPLPVADYRSTLKVSGDAHRATVRWSSSFRRKDEQPAPGADDAGAKQAITGIYRAGLDALKASQPAGR